MLWFWQTVWIKIFFSIDYFSYGNRLWNDRTKQGILEIQHTLQETYNNEVTLVQASMRWLVHHSKLIDNDGIILGVSKPEHLLTNCEALDGGPLHENVVNAFENAWVNIETGIWALLDLKHHDSL